MNHRRDFHLYFWIILAIGLVLASHSSPARANLSGSNVTFAPSVSYAAGKTSASCYIPGKAQMLCFNLDTTSPDGQDATALAIQFPSDWDVRGQWVGDHYDYSSIEHSCTNGGTMNAATSWSGFARAGQYTAGDNRVQNAGTSCHALYCFYVTDQTNPGDPPYDDELDATVSWSWAGDVGTSPQSVCSSDALYPQDGFPCESVSSSPPATVPVCEFTPITILPETLPRAIAGQYYTQQLSPTNPDPNNPTYYYTRTNTMPSDFSLYSNTGQIVWNNPQTGTYTFTAYVRGPGWSEGSRQYTIVVDPPFIFDPAALPGARQNTAYNQPITVTGGTAPYVLSLQSGTLPAGISFTNGAFSGTPTETGEFSNLVILATDANGISQTRTYKLTVIKEHLFTWTPANPASGDTVTFTAESGYDSHKWSYGYSPEGTCNTDIWGNYSEVSLSLFGKGNHKVCLELTSYNPTYTVVYDEQWVTVTNGAPIYQSSWVSPSPSFPGQPVGGRINFIDNDGPGSFTCEVEWGDGTIETTSNENGEFACRLPQHVYTAVGVYEIMITVTDDEGANFEVLAEHHPVVYLFAQAINQMMASNTLPTSIRLTGHAPMGTEILQFNITTPPAHGSLGMPEFDKCVPDAISQSTICTAHVTYTPTITSPLFVGDDSFEFTVSDANHTSDPAHVQLRVDENNPPTAEDGTALVISTQPSGISIFASDMDAYNSTLDEVTFIIDTQPQHGTLQFSGDPQIDEELYDDDDWYLIGARWSQALIYTPFPGTTAETDTFTFHVNDSHQDSNIATISLTFHTPITLHVNVNDDVVDMDGCNAAHCSLREAVAAALIGDTIDFTLPLPNTITLTADSGGELLISQAIHILGPGADQLAISAGFTDPEMDPSEGFRVIQIYNPMGMVDVEIAGLTIRDGRSFAGGGILVYENAILTLRDCVIGPSNVVAYAGGGIAVIYAELNMYGSTVIGNEGTGTLGGAGMVAVSSDLTITNSTITGNITNNYGGGLLVQYLSNVNLTHTTISGNIANQDYETQPQGGGGGIVNQDSTVTMQNCIVAGNTDLTLPSVHAKWHDVNGSVVSLGGNIVGDKTGSIGWLPGDIAGTSTSPVDPLLGLLNVHEPGKTPTFPLLQGSPAIDFAVCSAAAATDQRGIKRPQGIMCDSGAFEVENSLTYLFIPLILR